jgi:hypothetical protein
MGHRTAAPEPEHVLMQFLTDPFGLEGVLATIERLE